MNVGYYVIAFDQAVDEFLDYLGMGLDYVRHRNSSTFVLEIHVNYLNEVEQGETIAITCQLLAFDHKRLHYFLEMRSLKTDTVVATCEQVGVHVDLVTRRSSAFPSDVKDALAALMTRHADLPRSPCIGRTMGLGK